MNVKIEENEILKKFWEIEDEPNTMAEKILTPEEQECEDIFYKTTKRDAFGRYIMELPFRSNHHEGNYGDTRNIGIKRLLSLERRLAKYPNQRKDYVQVLWEYVTLGHMEEIPLSSRFGSDKVWLPHHAVIRPDKSTTKTRVVFNASDRSANGLSLNDTLMVGPTLQAELRHIIMRWRLHPICLTADIIKMYRQVKVAEKHVDYQRIVWREDPASDIKDFRILRVTFGTACAPYLAVKSLQQLAVDDGHFFPLAADRVKTDFYMDDLMTGCQSETEAIQLYEQFNSLLKRGGFTLQKWASNRKGRLETMKENEENDKDIKEDEVTKILGLTWNRRTDEFDYTVKLESETVPETKRKIIAEICRLYDPLGCTAPCLIKAKVFIQKLWLCGYEWDIKLRDEHLREWELYREEKIGKLPHTSVGSQFR
ncbi:uncharacterized protein LOC124533067 [Vanessa cardui]|uniref:uncharacterized protein LOC124533067 n=1 Tax=Vanessa cardui TaxID=171605 RepID=UPI001F13EA2E|nr:uncharacterized protein LOC124533067 [Vanessa cardui]